LFFEIVAVLVYTLATAAALHNVDCIAGYNLILFSDIYNHNNYFDLNNFQCSPLKITRNFARTRHKLQMMTGTIYRLRYRFDAMRYR